MKRLGAVYGGSAPHHRSLNEPKYARWLSGLVYLPELPGADLSGFDGLILPERLHRGLLEKARPQLLGMLERGGTLVVFGEQSVYGPQPGGWLPGLQWEYRPTNYWWWTQPQPNSGIVAALPDHSLFDHVSLDDATWHHHGVFWPPTPAETIVATEDGASVLYVDQVRSQGVDQMGDAHQAGGGHHVEDGLAFHPE
jgi:hypothetical protein